MNYEKMLLEKCLSALDEIQLEILGMKKSRTKENLQNSFLDLNRFIKQMESDLYCALNPIERDEPRDFETAEKNLSLFALIKKYTCLLSE